MAPDRSQDPNPEGDARDERPDPQGRFTATEESADRELDSEAAGSEDETAKTGEASSVEQDIEALTAEMEKLQDRHLRLAAEFDNFRKRTLRERARDTERAQAELAKQLLEALDDLTRVTGIGDDVGDSAALLEGVRLVERKLQRALAQSGLQRIPAEGEQFDPELHEALTTIPTDDPDQDGVIARELATGYRFGDILLRPAMVEVKKYNEGAGGRGGDGRGVETGS